MGMVEKAYYNESAADGLSDYIRDYMKYWFSRPRELSFFFLSMSKSFESKILMDYYEEYVAASTEFFVGMFRKAADLGEIKITDPEAYGITLMGALDGVLTYAMIHPELEVDALADRVKKIWFDKE
jgi:AcrR family transcriptional regulator